MEITASEWDKLCGVMNGYIYSQTIATACELELFTFLERHDRSDQQAVAAGLSLSPHATRVLLLACCTAGLVERNAEGRYYNSELASKVLVADSPLSMVPFILFNYRVQQRCSTHLTQALREGRNAGLDELPGRGDTLYERLASYPELEHLFHEAMGAYTRITAGVAVGMVDILDLAGVRHLLDVGGGDASTAVRLCRRYPGLRVTTLDKPSVTKIARERVDREGLRDRIHCEEQDIFGASWPQGCDAVLMSHLVEIFSPEKVELLYGKAFAVLPEGGTLFVWTIMSDDEETGGLQAAKSSIYFLSTASGEGMAYPARAHEQWLRSVGFEHLRRIPASAVEHGALVAMRGRGARAIYASG